jgi:anti-anti-sigma factor
VKAGAVAAGTPARRATGLGPERGVQASAAHDFVVYDFAVSIHTGGQTAIVLQGELDLASVERFETACASIDFSSVARAVLDLRDLAFIDVIGLRAVLRFHARCLDQSVELLIRPGPRIVQKMFELTGTDCLLPFERTDMTHTTGWETE